MIKFLPKTDRKLSINNSKIALIIFVFFLFVTTAAWVQCHTLVPTYDPSWYLEYSEIFYHALTDNGPLAFLNAFITSFHIKAPLISVLPLPFYPIFGNNENTAYIPLLLCLILFNVYLFKLVKIFYTDQEATLACFIVGTFPAVYSMTRQFFVEYFLMTVVLIWIYCVLKSDFYRLKKYNIILGVVFGIGMLLKVLFPLFILVPALIVLTMRIRQDNNAINEKLFKDLGLIALIGILISSTWYVKNFHSVFRFVFQNSIGTVAKDYSMGSVFSWDTIWRYWQSIINFDFSFYWFFVFFVALSGYLTNKKRKRINKFFLSILLGWFLLPFILCTFSVNKASRFLLPAYLPVGVWLSIFIVNALHRSKIKTTIIGSLLVFPLFNYLYTSFDINKLPVIEKSKYGFILIAKRLGNAYPPVKQYWPLPEIVDFIYKDSIWRAGRTFIAITSSLPEFNHNNFRYYAALKNYRNLDFGGLPTNSKDAELKRLQEGVYIIIKEGGNKGPGFLNRYNDEIQEMLDKGQLLYKKIGGFALPDKGEAVIYRRDS